MVHQGMHDASSYNISLSLKTSILDAKRYTEEEGKKAHMGFTLSMKLQKRS